MCLVLSWRGVPMPRSCSQHVWRVGSVQVGDAPRKAVILAACIRMTAHMP